MSDEVQYTGLKDGLKHAFVTAFRAGLTDEFWQNLSPVMKDPRPEDHVLPEFPTVPMEFPIVRVDVTINTIHWTTMQRNELDATGNPRKTGRATPNVTVYFYALSAKQRDRLMDAYINMLLFWTVKPDHMAFTKCLAGWPGIGIHPVLNRMSIGQDNAGKGIPWCEDDYVYMNTLSFDAEVVFYMEPKPQDIALIEEVNVHANPYK